MANNSDQESFDVKTYYTCVGDVVIAYNINYTARTAIVNIHTPLDDDGGGVEW
jgi:hypothetical protein